MERGFTAQRVYFCWKIMMQGKLKYLSPEQIKPNPENPRIFFREEEMESLLLSIDNIGIQVPISVYESSDGSYILLDGERRWRCARKLALRQIPAIVRDEPNELQNLLFMYNIHALREQWDYFTIATKLIRVIDLMHEELSYPPNEKQLSEATGLSRGQIRRCMLLIDLPEKFQILLREELSLPKQRQRLTEDFFIEMERSLKTIYKRVPEDFVPIDDARDILVEKFQVGKIQSVTDFRQLAKIATAIEGLDVSKTQAISGIRRIFTDPDAEIRPIYDSLVRFEYTEREVEKTAHSLIKYLSEIKGSDEYADRIDDELIILLKKVHFLLSTILRATDG